MSIGKTANNIPSVPLPLDSSSSPGNVPAGINRELSQDEANRPRISESARSGSIESAGDASRSHEQEGPRFSESQALAPRGRGGSDSVGERDGEEKAFNPEPPSLPRPVVNDLDGYDHFSRSPAAAKARDVLLSHTSKLLEHLATEPAGKESNKDAINHRMAAMDAVFRKLLREGVPHAVALQTFVDAVTPAFKAMDSDQLHWVLILEKDLAPHADAGNRNIVTRHLAQAIASIDKSSESLNGLRRQALDREREVAAREAKTLREKAGVGIMKAIRAPKALKRELKAEHGPAAKAAAAADTKREADRSAVATHLQGLINLTKPGALKLDQPLLKLVSDLSVLRHRTQGRANDEVQAQWHSNIEDFLIDQPADALVALASRLLEIIPHETHVELADLGQILHGVLELRPECAGPFKALGRGDLLLSSTPAESRQRRIDHTAELLSALPISPEDLQPMILDDLEATGHWHSIEGSKDFAAEAVKKLDWQQLQSAKVHLEASGAGYGLGKLRAAVSAQLETVQARRIEQEERIAAELAPMESELIPPPLPSTLPPGLDQD